MMVFPIIHTSFLKYKKLESKNTDAGIQNSLIGKSKEPGHPLINPPF